MRKNVRKPLTNFYDTDQSEGEGHALSTSSSSTHSNHVTIVLEESSVSSISNHSGDIVEENFPKLITVATPTLQNLEEAVVQAKRRLQRFDILILQAIWKSVLHHSQGDGSAKRPFPSGGSKPFSVKQRRAQLMAATQPSSHTHSSGLRLFSSKPNPMNIRRQVSNSLSSTRPFLPTSRFPATPQLNPKERLQFNNDLYEFIEETKHSGLIKSGEAPNSSRNTGVQASSLRSIALKIAMERNNTKVTEPSSSQKYTSLMGSSVSLIILDLGRKRALAVFFLRYLRLQAYQRRILLEEFQWRYTYRLQWNMLQKWCGLACSQRTHRLTLLKHVVDHWQNVVARQKSLHSLMQRFHARLIDSLRDTKICKATQRRKFFLGWRNKFTKCRVMRAMNDAADSFRLSKDEDRTGGGGTAPKTQYLPVFYSKDGLEEVKNPWCSDTLICVLRHWKNKMVQRLKTRLADLQYAQYMKRHVFKKFKQIANRNRTSVSTQMTLHPPPLLPIPTQGFETVGESPLNRDNRTTYQCGPIVNVMPSPPEVWHYKEKMALQVVQTIQLRRTYRQWWQHYQCRRGSLHYNRKIQLSTMRRWMSSLARRRIDRLTCQAVLDCWREKLHKRSLESMAADIYVRSAVSRTFYIWRLNFMFRSRTNSVTMRWCLQQWWERAALRIGERTLTIHHRERLFYGWKARASFRGRCRAFLLLADRLRETNLLVHCIRIWSKKVKNMQKTQAMCGIIERLNLEHRREVCFFKWKRRVFKSTSLPQVVSLTET
ncbi:unnamed protein product [Phytomonas sp. Hart1]|nr:unnamed protein product [Phytomonas sp. Hart1]|eukprot:CCW68890.1 unnamed protein product [Phytomonas sp. isolate Hart1]